MFKVRPDFCTVVMPEEYDYIGQFEEAIKSANEYHQKMHTECPPPYFPMDVGKVVGLILELEKLKSKS